MKYYNNLSSPSYEKNLTRTAHQIISVNSIKINKNNIIQHKIHLYLYIPRLHIWKKIITKNVHFTCNFFFRF